MAKISWKPGTMLFPVPPVMVTSGTMKQANVMTVAWTGIVNSEPPLTYISVRPSRHSYSIINETKEFVINIANLPLAKACDFCGVKSGRTTNKFKEMNLTLEPCTEVKTPMIKEAPVALECKVIEVKHFGTHDMFLAEIVNVNIDDKYIEEDGRLAIEKAGLLAFAHGRYYTLGRDLGAFGFSVDKTKENKTKPRKSKFMEILKVEEKLKKGLLDIKAKPAIKKARAKLKKDDASSFKKRKSFANKKTLSSGKSFSKGPEAKTNVAKSKGKTWFRTTLKKKQLHK